MINVVQAIEDGILSSRDALLSQTKEQSIPSNQVGITKEQSAELWNRYQELEPQDRLEFVKRGVSAQNPLLTTGELVQEKNRYEQAMLDKFGVAEEVLLNGI